MFRDNKNRIRFFIILVTMWFLGVGGIAHAHTAWLEKQVLHWPDDPGLIWSVSINGNNMIVGAPDNDGGAAYVFTRDTVTELWVLQDELQIGNWWYFGASAAISEDHAVVGDHMHWNYPAVQSGGAFIFKRSDVPNDPNWYEQAYLYDPNGEDLDHFGESADIWGDFIIVGADWADVNGQAYIYRREDPNWILETKLTTGGDDVALDNNYALVSNSWDANGLGYVCVYKRDDTEWHEEARLRDPNGKHGDLFGVAVDIDEDWVIVGASQDDDIGEQSGSAFIFKREGTSWILHQKLTASDATDYAFFGLDVAISGNRVIVGASSQGVTTAYIYQLEAGNWTNEIRLSEEHGCLVSISGSYAVKAEVVSGYFAKVFKECICPTADLSGDCFVDFADFAVMANQWLIWGK